MTGLELLEKYPLAKKIVKDWFMKSMLESFKDENVPEEFKQFMLEQGIEDDKVGKLIDVNVRILFDVFDENEIFISINVTDRKFSYRIDNVINPTEYSTRKECELISITRAFDILETKLTPIELPALEEIEVAGEEIVEE
jgi:mRNA-degrading endonuclease RelE of RelBE toxin-antitoxin system